jgi:4-amino-4-deoxy-L-arabinose transferase-like glycosyltransferase
MKLQIKWWGWLILILVVGAVVRFGWFGQSPPSLNWDEASLGYNAYSIALTAKDEWNRLLPISFEAFGDFKLPVYIYASVPWVKIFGLSEWSIRLTSMLAGVVSIGLVYLIGYQLFSSR